MLMCLQFEKTYIAEHVVRPDVAALQSYLAFLHGLMAYVQRTPALYSTVVEHHMAALSESGVSLPSQCVAHGPRILSAARDEHNAALGSVIQIVAAYSALDNLLEARAWLQEAIWLHNLIFCGGEELFKIRYKTMLETLRLWSLLPTNGK